MSKTMHSVFVWTMVVIVIITTAYLSYVGYSFYSLPLEERFYHPNYDWFKPAGTMGHGLGIVGTFFIVFGVVIYILRKRYNILSRYIRLKYLLEFHIFLCSLGPILILFHTTFKFGGVVSIAFWSMVAVVLSGVIGRFIYIQIPRSIEGRELSILEVKELRDDISSTLQNEKKIKESTLTLISNVNSLNSMSISDYFKSKSIFNKIKHDLGEIDLTSNERLKMIASIRKEVSLSQRIERLQTMQKLFKYWHVAHLPFALIMLVIVLFHVIVTLALGYNWVF